MSQKLHHLLIGGLCAVLLASLLAGCKGISTRGERESRAKLKAVTQVYEPDRRRDPSLLTTDSELSDYLQFAMLTHPSVEAAYYDWYASVERITVERSLPDPRLTFSTDIQSMVAALMPGLMIDLPGPGKLSAAASVATAESDARYFQFERAVLQAAFDLKRAYYRLHFLEERVRINLETLDLLGDLERLARTQNEVGKVTLQDVLRAQIEQQRVATEIANLKDSRNPLLAEFKGALGLRNDDPTPPIPRRFESTSIGITSDELFSVALKRNPRLRAMEAEIRAAEAGIRVARRSRVPDVTLGVEVDVKAVPTMWTPEVGITLPIWRDKIAAQIQAAQANKRAAEARFGSEEIALAVEFADRTFDFRESSRNLTLLEKELIPKARQSLEVARPGYASGKASFLDLIEAERALFGFQLDAVEARTQRELALTELSLLIAGVPPSGAPVLQGEAGATRDARQQARDRKSESSNNKKRP